MTSIINIINVITIFSPTPVLVHGERPFPSSVFFPINLPAPTLVTKLKVSGVGSNEIDAGVGKKRWGLANGEREKGRNHTSGVGTNTHSQPHGPAGQPSERDPSKRVTHQTLQPTHPSSRGPPNLTAWEQDMRG